MHVESYCCDIQHPLIRLWDVLTFQQSFCSTTSQNENFYICVLVNKLNAFLKLLTKKFRYLC